MTAYAIESVIVETESATSSYENRSLTEVLHRSRRGRYYIEHRDDRPWAEWASPETAVRWLMANGYEAPRELAEAAVRLARENGMTVTATAHSNHNTGDARQARSSIKGLGTAGRMDGTG